MDNVYVCDASTKHNLPETEPENAQLLPCGGCAQAKVSAGPLGQEGKHGLVEAAFSVDYKQDSDVPQLGY